MNIFSWALTGALIAVTLIAITGILAWVAIAAKRNEHKTNGS